MKRVVLICVLAMVACHRDGGRSGLAAGGAVAVLASGQLCRLCVLDGVLDGLHCIRVSDGSVVAAQTQPTSSTAGSPLDPREQDEPIEALFSQLSPMQECRTKDVAYDETYGFVRSYYLDCGEEGWGEKVPCFAAHSNDLSACDGVQD